MKNKILFLISLVLLLPIAGRAQGFEAKQLVVSLRGGGFVSFKNQTAWIDFRRALGLQKLPAELGSQALTDQSQTIHRIFRDNDGRYIFGYDLWVSGDTASKQFKIEARPLDAEVESSLRAQGSAGAEPISTFPKSSAPQTLADGAEFSLDLLINKDIGVKIIDVVKVTFDRSRLGIERPAVNARDFSLDVVALDMKDYSLMANASLIAMGKSKTGCSGALLWIYIPNRGRFIFSLTPREGYPFQKSGIIAGNKIEFDVNGDHYEWLSSSAILREEGVWNLWVLHDTQYSPLFAIRQPPPTEKGVLDKLDSAIGTMPNAITVPSQQPKVFNIAGNTKKIEKNSVTPRDVVMMGSADRIENLLPRN